MNKLLSVNTSLPISSARQMVNLRNRVIHAYDDVDEIIVWKIIMKDIPMLIQEIETLMRRIKTLPQEICNEKSAPDNEQCAAESENTLRLDRICLQPRRPLLPGQPQQRRGVYAPGAGQPHPRHAAAGTVPKPRYYLPRPRLRLPAGITSKPF